ncbi:MAG: hypothetical protein RJAPGHWK_001869, partial [Candidatus Fervidibacter sp.]
MISPSVNVQGVSQPKPRLVAKGVLREGGRIGRAAAYHLCPFDVGVYQVLPNRRVVDDAVAGTLGGWDPCPKVAAKRLVLLHRPGLVVVLHIHLARQTDLLGVGQASGLAGFLAGLAKDGEQDGCQDRNYRDHYQQLNEGEP